MWSLLVRLRQTSPDSVRRLGEKALAVPPDQPPARFCLTIHGTRMILACTALPSVGRGQLVTRQLAVDVLALCRMRGVRVCSFLALQSSLAKDALERARR